jgi:NADP-dependent 3-hydroxy acid dehydrogenase YdfG
VTGRHAGATAALAGAVALVTGAADGIGAATARRLAAEGAAVALVARHDDPLDRLVAELRQAGRTAVAVSAVPEAHDRLGRLDVLVNSAGVMLLGTALHTRVADWDRMVELNVSALLHVTHAAVPYLIDAAATSVRGVADIVNVGSAAARAARPAGGVHALTTYGLGGFTDSLGQELLAEHVRVSLVEPGTVGTEPAEPRPGGFRDAWPRTGGLDALRAEDVADAIAHIVTRDRRIAVTRMLVRATAQT